MSLLSCRAPQAGGSCWPAVWLAIEGGDGVRPFKLPNGECAPFRLPLTELFVDMGRFKGVMLGAGAVGDTVVGVDCVLVSGESGMLESR